MADNDDNIPPPPPPPPRPEPDAFAPQDIFQSDAGDGGQQMDSGKPSVAASPTRVFVVLGAMGALLLYLLYNIFFAGAGYDQDDGIADRSVADTSSRPIAPAPPPPLVEEQLPPPAKLEPPPIPEPTQLPEIKPEDDEANNKALLDRLKSNMLILNSGGSIFGGDSAQASEDDLSALDPNSQFGMLVKRSTSKAEKVTATHIGDLNRTIAQGRLIQATLETVINTDLPGPIRAIVSRDIFGEAGTVALIPKGSRLIGQYNSNIVAGQSRVYVVWTRVIRPDGVDVALGSPLTDQIGQAGVGGFVDNKFREMFSRSVLASIFSIVVALGVDEIQGDEQNQTTSTISTDGTISQSGSAASSASVNALNRLGSITGSFISRFVNIKPTILVDQGSPVMVFVNRDLIFPAELVGARNIP